METTLRNLLIADVPQAAAIWLGLLVIAVLALALLSAQTMTGRAAPTGDPHRSAAGPDLPFAAPGAAEPGWSGAAGAGRSGGVRRGVPAPDEEARRYAGEVAVAAERAAATARRRRAEWLAAQDAVEAAWRAFDAADNELRRMAAAVPFPAPRTPRTPAEFADRERYLHKAATAACRRRELPVRELSDALAHRHGWDPRRHPVQQEVVLRRVSREHLLHAYRAGSHAERSAWHAAEVAAAAAVSLREEAYAAALRVADRPTRYGVDRSARAWSAAPAPHRPRLATR